MNEMESIIFEIILHSGNAKSLAMEAIANAKEREFTEATKKLEEASEALAQAHHAQTNLLHREANQEKIEINVLLIHAQDHLMTSMTTRDLAEEMVELYKKLG